jgi:homoserine O-succinyltransferase
MPDGAFEATEQQFLDLLNWGSGSEEVEVRLCALAGVPRGERTTARIAEQYSSLAALRADPPDLLIVTGSNPLQAQIRDEPYWADLRDLLSWGSRHVPSMVLSCLSAHAALAHFDGIERVRLPAKCTGVFAQDVAGDHPLVAGIEPTIVLPHSRLSEVPRDALVGAGYRVVVQSDAIGWSVATRTIDRSHVVLLQGHPEYQPPSLLREYHRDARRYVQHERDDLPCLPFHCVAPEDWGALEDLHRTIIGGRREVALLNSYPFDEVGSRAPWSWSTMARRLFANVLAGVTRGSAHFDAR